MGKQEVFMLLINKRVVFVFGTAKLLQHPLLVSTKISYRCYKLSLQLPVLIFTGTKETNNVLIIKSVIN